MKVYLSSTYSDLKTHRRSIYDALRSERYDVIAMEDYIAGDQRPLEKCLHDVAVCDVYIGIFAWCYGYIPHNENPKQKSITELEYRHAMKLGKPCLIFVLDEVAPWNPQFMDVITKKGNNGACIEELRKELCQEHLVSFFKTPEDLARLVIQTIHIWEVEAAKKSQEQYEALTMQKEAEREKVLRAMLADHTGFLRDRLESFVGRENELDEIKQRIAQKMQTGGYVTITGQAGQGKSSVIAKLVEQYGIEKVAYHFIPFNPGPDHQVGLLRNLMARLVLKYDLPEFYVASESRPALRDFFPKVLMEVINLGGQEVLFVDGLDQLEEEQSGVRDLSFLPTNPPPGIVFVLGTRPNDTLKPLELLKPRHEYELPPLSRYDFDLILQRDHVQLSPDLASQFYTTMQKNALYLDLIAKELAQEKSIHPEEIIKRLTTDPDSIFSLSVERLQKKPNDIDWHEVLKPILAVLLVARMPLSVRHIRQILFVRKIMHVDDQRLRRGLQRLGGLISDDGRQRFSLFHLKLYDYLRQDENRASKTYIFATDEEISWHYTLAQWCEGDVLAKIWNDEPQDLVEQARREYARRHYIAHLFSAQAWQQLFAVIDAGSYGQAKIHDDPSMRSYAQDLDLGRQAAALQSQALMAGIALLPRLWYYTLLRCSLASRADRYPLVAFRLLWKFGRETEALNLAELLTNAAFKVEVLREIAKLMLFEGREKDHMQLLFRTREVVNMINDDRGKRFALLDLADDFVRAKEWNMAENILRMIVPEEERVGALQKLAQKLAEAHLWQQAEQLLRQAEALKKQALEKRDDDEIEEENDVERQELESEHLQKHDDEGEEDLPSFAQALVLTEEVSSLPSDSNTSMNVWSLQALHTMHFQTKLDDLKQQATRILVLDESGNAQEEIQEREKLKVLCEELENTIKSPQFPLWPTSFLYGLGEIWNTIRQFQRAEALWGAAEATAHAMNTIEEKIEALCELSKILIKAQKYSWARTIWDQIEELIFSIEVNELRTKELALLALTVSSFQEHKRAEKLWREVEKGTRALANLEKENSKTLGQICDMLVQAQELDRLESLAKTSELYQNTTILSKLSIALTQLGEWERAWNAVRLITDYFEKVEVLTILAESLTNAGQFAKAEMVWREAEEEGKERVITALIRNRYWDRARVMIDKVVHSWNVIDRLYELWQGLVLFGEINRATIIWNDIRSNIELGNYLRTDTLRILCMMSEVLIDVSDKIWVYKIWDVFQTQIHLPYEDNKSDDSLRVLGEATAYAHQWESAEQIFLSIEEISRREEALKVLGEMQLQAQELKKAEKVFDSIKEQWRREEAFKELSEVLRQALNWDDAEAVLYTLGEGWRREEALKELGMALAYSGEWDHAQRVVLSLQEQWRREEALQDLRKEMIHAYEWERAEALILLLTIPEERAIAWRELIMALTVAQEWKRAVLVCAKAKLALNNNGRRGIQLKSSIDTQDAHIAMATQLLSAYLPSIKEWELINIWDPKEVVQRLPDIPTRQNTVSLKTTQKKWQMRSNVSVQQTQGKQQYDESSLKLLLQKVQQAWREAETREEAIARLPLVADLIPLQAGIGKEIFTAFSLVDAFLQGKLSDS